MGAPKILVIEDNRHFSEYICGLLKSGYDVIAASDMANGLKLFRDKAPDLVILDLRLPRRPGLPEELVGFEILDKIKQIDPLAEVIIITGTSNEIEDAVKAIRKGAFNFIIKDDYKVLEKKVLLDIENALNKRALSRDNHALKSQLKQAVKTQRRAAHMYYHPQLNYNFGCILGESAAMQPVYEFINKVSQSGTKEPVIIYGESGTGKELVAQSIHAGSDRGERAWLTLNIASLSQGLVASELFGSTKGAFTGAEKDRDGYFAEADGSTLFLDEIGEIPLDVQVSLLRTLQEGEIKRVGDTSPIKVDVRVIAATHRNLTQLIEEGRFREDLYYRLSVLPVTLPALKERLEDIPILAKHILHKMQREDKIETIDIADSAYDLLQSYSWPGNIRELNNILKKAIIMRDKDILDAGDFRELLPDAWMGNHIPVDTLMAEELPAEQTPIEFKDLQNTKQKNRLFLRSFIENEGRMEGVLKSLDIARGTGFKYVEDAQVTILSELCQAGADIERLAAKWEVSADKLDKTIKRANRIAKYMDKLQSRFERDNVRLAAFLNTTLIKVEEVKRLLE